MILAVRRRFAIGRGEALFAALGLVIIAAVGFTIAATRSLSHTQVPDIQGLWPLLAGLSIPSALLLLSGPAIVRLAPTASAMAILIAVGLMMRLAWLGSPPPLDDDYFRYLWDGAMVAQGHDPYRHAPAEFLLSDGFPVGHQPITARARAVIEQVNFPEMRTIYPSVAQAAFALAHLIAPLELDGLRIVLLGGELATLLLMLAILRAGGAAPMWAALYWWNPLAAAMAVGFSHVDALIPPLVLGALMAVMRERRLLAVVLLGLGAGVKIWPLLLAPIVLWPLVGKPRQLIVACGVLSAVLLLAVGPVIWSALRPGSGLSAYVGGWSNNNAFYAWAVVGLREVLGLGAPAEAGLRLVLALATAGVALRQAMYAGPRSLIVRFTIVAAAVFYLSPAQFPWYALWFLPLAALAGCWPLLLSSALLPFYYLIWLHWPLEGGRTIFYGIAFIHSLPVLGWLLWEYLRGRDASNAVRSA